MSVNTIGSYNWNTLPNPSGILGASQGATFDPVNPASASPAAATASPVASPNGQASGTNGGMFQQLAADIQAVLVQGQAYSATPATGSTTTSGGAAGTNTAEGTTATNPAQQLASDLQSIYAQLQGNATNGDPSTQEASNAQATPNGQTQPHQHHHHHHMSSGASTTSASDTSATATSSTSSSGNASASDTVQGVSQALSAAILQVLQAYGNSTASSASLGLTALA